MPGESPRPRRSRPPGRAPAGGRGRPAPAVDLTGSPRVVRVLPDVSGLDKLFDYTVPDRWSAPVRVGTRVRVDLHGRRVGGWIVAVDVSPPPGVALRPLAHHAGEGPPPDVVELARWVAHRWHGRWAAVLASASADRKVPSPLRPAPPTGGARPGPSRPQPQPAAGTRGARGRSAADATAAVGADRMVQQAGEALVRPGVSVVRVPPCEAPDRLVLAAAARGPALVVHPSVAGARHLAGRLRRHGVPVALHPEGWAEGAAGGRTVVGSRSAVLAPIGDLSAVVVLDEHDESLQEERNPTWHAREVAVERARRAGVPCLLVSPCPSLAALAVADRVLTPSRVDERAGWPIVDVVDRRREDPGRAGMFSPGFLEAARRADRVVCVLNRTGRARLLACASCGELVRTEDGRHVMIERDGHLESPVTGEVRPAVCAVCTGTKLKRLRLGVDRVRDELEALLREPVAEITAEATAGDPDARVVVGTEAALHRAGRAGLVAFLDVDQELLAPRYRAAEQAMALLVRGARLVGARSGGGRVLVQTRNPDHRVLQAAVRADPGRLAIDELDQRRALGFPPAGALAEVSGAGAADLVAQLDGRLGVALLGPRDGRWLVRAGDPAALAEALAETRRPKARVRVAVDPPRI